MFIMKKIFITIGLSLFLIPATLVHSASIVDASMPQVLASSMPSMLNQKQQLIFKIANLEVMEAMESIRYRQDSPRIKSLRSQREMSLKELRKIDSTDQRREIKKVRSRIAKQEIKSLQEQIRTRSLRFSKNSPQIVILKDQITTLRKLSS
jgi:uncharacterized protein involved in exopolysaccharide biosynthesis